MHLYHATRTDFSQFRLDGDHTLGVNGAAETNKAGNGIYLFPQIEDADDLVSAYHRAFQYDSVKRFRFLQKNTVPHMDCTPFLTHIQSESYCSRLGPQSVIVISGAAVSRRDYEAYLYKIKKMNPTAVRTVLTKCILEQKPLSETVLSAYLRQTHPFLTSEQIEPVVRHFANKKITEKMIAVPFKGRVLKVTLADDAKILDDSKTIAQNECAYDFEAICQAVHPNRETHPVQFIERVADLYWLDDFHNWRDHPDDIRKMLKKNQQTLTQALCQKDKLPIDGHLLTIAQTMLKTLIDQSTYHGIRVLSHHKCGQKDALLTHFDYDGVLLRDLDPYDTDVYCVHRLEKLQIESYKPYGSQRWLPVQKVPTTADRLNRFRNGGLEM